MLRTRALRLPLALALAATPLVVATPAQAQPNALHVTGEVQLVTAMNDLEIGHTIRHADGSWDRFGTRDAGLAYPRNLVSSIVNGAEHLVYETHNPRNYWELYRQIRHADGTWDTKSVGYGQSSDLAVTTVAGELHVVRRGKDVSGSLEHFTLHADGTWTYHPAIQVDAAAQSSASVAGVGGELHLLLTNAAGTGFTSIVRGADGTWAPGVAVPFATWRGDVRASTVDIAQVGTDLHAVVRGSDTRLYHSTRSSNGSWATFHPVGPSAGDPGAPLHVSVTASRGTLHLAVSTRDGGLFHTIRFADGTWQQFGDVKGVAGSIPSGEVTIAGE